MIGKTMSSVTADQIQTALRGIIDPQTGTDVVTRGMIQGLSAKDGHVTFAVEVDAKDGKSREPLRQACEKAVLALQGVRSVSAVLTAHRPPAATPQQQPADRQRNPKGVGTIIAVASGKGGVGKSTVTVNLAIALKDMGFSTGILDADIYGPSIPKMLGLKGKPTSKDGKILQPMHAWGLKTMSFGSLLNEDQPAAWRGPMVITAITQLLFDVDWDPLDVLLVDMPPGTGDAQLTLAQRVPLGGAVIVSTPQDIALIDARKGMAMFQRTHVPVLGMVENMSTFVCPHCGNETHIFGHDGARLTAEKIGCDFLGEVPLHIAIRETSDGGAPITATQPESAQAQAFMAIATRLAGKIRAGTQRRAPTISFE